MPTPRRPRAVLLAVLAVAAAGCGVSAEGGSAVSDAQPAEALRVVATTSILGDVVGDLVGDAGTVTTLMGPGVDPHAFEASPRQAQSLREADLVVTNGLRLEEALLDALEAAEQDGAEVFALAPELDPIGYERAGADAHADGHQDEPTTSEGADDHEAQDPHVWLDASRMAQAASLIAAEIAGVDTTGDVDWRQRGQRLAGDLEALDDEVADILTAVPEDRRTLVTNHESLGYFADRYGFEILGAVIPGGSTQAETNPRQLGELAATIERAQVPAIFADSTSSTRLAEALREEVGADVEVVTLYTGSLGPPDSGAQTYAGLMRTNAQRVADALAG